MTTRRDILILPLFLAILGGAAAQNPDRVNYSGTLSTDAGPVNGVVSLTFKVYDAVEGGTLLWTETQEVSVVGGSFKAVLGAVNPLTPVSAAGDYWFTLMYEGMELPRTQLFNREKLRSVHAAAELQPSAPVVDTVRPATLPYEGMLQHRGAPIDGSREMTFRLYDSAKKGTLLWSETQTVTITKGIFRTDLGLVSPLTALPEAREYWFSIAVDGSEMPRTRFTFPGAP